MPENVNIPSADSQSITVQWSPPDPPQGNITAYYIIYWKTSKGPQTNSSIKWMDTMYHPPYLFDITFLESQTQYTIVVSYSVEF